MSTRIEISPEKILWATERGGLTIDSLQDIYPKAISWIKNESRPTVNQLQDFAKKIHVPFGFLFLNNVPEEILPIAFFRSNGDVVKNPPLVIRDLVFELKRKQDWLSDFLEDQSSAKLSFVGSLGNYKDITIKEAANIIRADLNISELWYSETNKAKVFRYWIDKIEQGRILVISTGFHKHNKRPINVEICKGFTLINDLCPFIYINTNNLGGGRIFTLIHELVHVFVGESKGISYEPIKPSSTELEKFCDNVTSEILVPTNSFKEFWKMQQGKNLSDIIDAGASSFLVSKLVIIRKALDLNYISQADFWSSFNYYTQPFKKNKSSGGDYWNSKPYEVSRKFYNYVNNALKQGKILPTEAYKLTNMKGNTFNSFPKKS